MNKKDATVTAILADLGLRDSPPLSPDQEDLFQQIANRTEEDDFLDSVNRLFNQHPKK